MADEETKTVETENPEAGEDENQSLSSIGTKPVEEEQPVSLEDDAPPHLAEDSEPTPKPESTEKPDWVEEKFWKDGKLDGEGLHKSYNEVVKKMSSGRHKMPKDGKYDVSAFEGLDSEDEMLADFFELAKEQELSQDTFETLVKFHMETIGEIDAKIKYHRDEEIKKLGRNAEGIIKSNDAWLEKFEKSGVITTPELASIANASTNALFISALNKIRRSYNEENIPSGNVVSVPARSLEEITAQMSDPKYGTDPIFTQKVEKEMYAFHGEEY